MAKMVLKEDIKALREFIDEDDPGYKEAYMSAIEDMTDWLEGVGPMPSIYTGEDDDQS